MKSRRIKEFPFFYLLSETEIPILVPLKCSHCARTIKIVEENWWVEVQERLRETCTLAKAKVHQETMTTWYDKHTQT